MTDHSKDNEKELSFKESILKGYDEGRKRASEEFQRQLEEAEKPQTTQAPEEAPVSATPEPAPTSAPQADQTPPAEKTPDELRMDVSRSAGAISLAQAAASKKGEMLFEAQGSSVVVPENAASSEVKASNKKKEESYGAKKRRKRARKEKKRANKKTKKASMATRIAIWVSSLLVVSVLAVIIGGGFYIHSALQPVDASAKEFVTVEIPEGSGNKQIGSILEKNGIIRNGTVFNYYAKLKNLGNFQSGYYNFRKSMDLDEIAAKLQEGGTDTPQEPVVGSITIPEGYTINQISDAVTVNAASKKQEKTPFTKEDFLKKVADDAFIDKLVAKYPNLLGNLPKKEDGVKYRLEGYLFPATYNYGEKTDVESLIEQMVAAMDAKLQPYYETIKAKNQTVNDVLTLASLVEKEGSTDQDRKDIASTFYNRLNQNMPLQSNIAILYAMDKLGQKTTLAEDAAIDTNIDSKYNIYKNPGLMPGPVDNAGIKAIDAVINPNKTDYLYFVANVTDGTVYFAKTYEEHEKNVQEHVNSKLESSSTSATTSSTAASS